MAYPSREQVYSALFAKFTSNQIIKTTFTTITRFMYLPTDVSVQKSPMLILWEGDGITRYDGHRLDKEEWHAAAVIYHRKSDKTVPGSTVINPLIDVVRDALQPDNQQQNVLVLKDSAGRQLVSWVRVEGDTVVENGDTDTEGLCYALIPLKMLVP